MIKKIHIEGMSCNHCVRHVEEALKEIDGVKAVNVDLQKKLAMVELASEIQDEKFKSAIDDAGYEVVKIEE